MKKVKKINEEELYDKFYYQLLDTLQKADKELPVPYIIYAGISTFTQLAVDFAPTEKDGKSWVRGIVNKAKREQD